MDTATIRELAHSPARVFERLRSGPLIVTRNGRPVAALYGLDEDALLDYVLANAPEFVRGMRQADRDLSEGRTRSLEDILAEHHDGRDGAQLGHRRWGRSMAVVHGGRSNDPTCRRKSLLVASWRSESVSQTNDELSGS